MHRSSTSWRLLLLSFAAVTASGCLRNSQFGAGDGADAASDCELGSLGCLCDSWGGCQLGLRCERDRCVQAGSDIPDSTTAPTTATPGASTEETQSTGTTSLGTSSEAGAPDSSEASTAPTSSSDPSSDEESSEADACKDGVKGQSETDIDCGGPVCSACENGQRCLLDLDCSSLYCVDGICAADDKPACASDLDCQDNNVCTEDRCINDRCENTALPDGEKCNDNEPCTAKDVCSAGRCTGQDTRVFYETFSDPENVGFELDFSPPERLWEAGPAKASSCSDSNYVEDPAQDHTQDFANGVLGVVIGGCSKKVDERNLDCAWTRYMDVSFFDEDVRFSFWRHLSTPGFVAKAPDYMRVRNAQYYRLKGDATMHRFKHGFEGRWNDKKWGYDYSPPLEKENFTAPVSFGICYRRVAGKGAFAGWSVDDVKVRQVGCEEEKVEDDKD